VGKAGNPNDFADVVKTKPEPAAGDVKNGKMNGYCCRITCASFCRIALGRS